MNKVQNYEILADFKAAEDGFTVIAYTKGQIVSLGPNTAVTAIKEKWAVATDKDSPDLFARPPLQSPATPIASPAAPVQSPSADGALTRAGKKIRQAVKGLSRK